MKSIFEVDRFIDELVPWRLFRDFPREELKTLLSASQLELREYEKDEFLHMQNEGCQAMDLILDGKVVVQNIDENGNVLIIDSFTGGELIGANLVFSSRNTYPMTVLATERTRTLLVKRDLILELCLRSSNFMCELLREISDKTIILTNKLNTITRKTIRQYIMDFLQLEQKRQHTNVIRLPLSKKELAERLGIPRSSLGRELIKMRGDGILDYDPWTITLHQEASH